MACIIRFERQFMRQFISFLSPDPLSPDPLSPAARLAPLLHPGSKRRILHTESRGKLSCRHSAALKLIEHRIAQLARRPHAPGSIDFKNLFRFRIHRLRNVWITQFTATELRRRYALRLPISLSLCAFFEGGATSLLEYHIESERPFSGEDKDALFIPFLFIIRTL